MVDPTSFARVGAPDYGQQGLAKNIIGMYEAGRQSRILGEERDRQNTGRQILNEAIQLYKNNDLRGFQDKINLASQYTPEEAKEIFSILGATDKSNSVEAAHHLLAAARPTAVHCFFPAAGYWATARVVVDYLRPRSRSHHRDAGRGAPLPDFRPAEDKSLRRSCRCIPP